MIIRRVLQVSGIWIQPLVTGYSSTVTSHPTVDLESLPPNRIAYATSVSRGEERCSSPLIFCRVHLEADSDIASTIDTHETLNNSLRPPSIRGKTGLKPER